MILKFLEENWTYIVAIGTVITYLFEKGRTIWLDKRKKKNSYNRILTAVLKLNFSYLKHSELYAEETPFNLSDDIYRPMLKNLDTFSQDIDEFKKSIDEEADINPEVIIDTHILFDTIDRIRIVDRMRENDSESSIKISDTENLGIKRAQFYAMEETFEDFFDEIITNLGKKTTTSKSFIQRIKSLKSAEYTEKAEKEQVKLMKRYFESLRRQNILPEEIYNSIIFEMGLEETAHNKELR